MPTKIIVKACLVALLACRTSSPPVRAQQPITPVPMTPFADGQNSVLNADLNYTIGDTKFTIVVPAGFVTDFASTPRAIWAVLPPADKYQLAAIVHDFLYWDQRCTREQADALLRAAMAESKIEPSKRDVIWRAVRRFGETAWRNNAQERAKGQPRIIPSPNLAIPALKTWAEYRAELFAEGVRPDATPAGMPDYCAAASAVKF